MLRPTRRGVVAAAARRALLQTICYCCCCYSCTCSSSSSLSPLWWRPSSFILPPRAPPPPPPPLRAGWWGVSAQGDGMGMKLVGQRTHEAIVRGPSLMANMILGRRTLMMMASKGQEGGRAGDGGDDDDAALVATLLEKEGVDDLSAEEIAMLDKMFKESSRSRRKNLRKQNSEMREKLEKKKGSSKPGAAAGNKQQQQQAAPKVVAGPPTATNEEEAMAQVKGYRKVEAPKRLVELVGHALDGGFMTERVLKAAVRSEMEMKRNDLALAILDTCHQRWPMEGGGGGGPGVKGRVEAVRWYCRLGHDDIARDVARAMGLLDSAAAAAVGTSTGSSQQAAAADQQDSSGGDGTSIGGGDGEAKEQGRKIGPMGLSVDDAAVVMMMLGKSALKANDTATALRDLRHLVRGLGGQPSMDYCNGLLQALSKTKQHQLQVDGLFTTLDLMREGGVYPDATSYQHLGNALVRSVEFVTGAVSMDTLPKREINEAVFIGRSNVGKSSLLNMVCARKDLAYVSKRPGKTQQFNYFIVNDNTRSAFYFVDVPGVGYAKVPLDQKAKWATFFQEYMRGRAGLRVIFHLIDSRHGPLDQDLATMDAIAQDLRPGVRYVVVLTKADKKDGKVSPTVKQDVQSALESRGLGGSPVVITSAVNKMGRDDMWRYLRLAVLSSPSS